ncbi:hypothetical protein HN903_00025 [archaeon]|jgi:hypothetical protein|nr:hypothetical protein [archaeon]MBT6956312.1 hypothetical protein [archaeon]MBT7128123.1 hypothetical protein [archaeon]
MEKRNKTISLLATIGIIALAILLNIPLNKQTIPTRFVGGENMGFDLGPGNLNFGQIIPGYSASRKITITNDFDKPTITKIETSGEISDCIRVSENNFILQPEESKNLTFSCFTTEDIEMREYAGEILIITKKA